MSAAGPPTPRNATVLLVLFTIANAVSFMDRFVLVLLIDPIRADLGLSDTAVSLVQGLAFILLYSTAAVPLGILLDRRNRLKIVGAGILVWSLATGLAGLARNFVELFAARAAVGLGEASLTPAAVSVLSDVTPPSQWGRRIAFFVAGASLGPALSYSFAGLLYDRLPQEGLALPLVGTLAPWRVVFVLAAIPGLLLAIVFVLLREPARRRAALGKTDAGTSLPVAPPARRRDDWNQIIRLLAGFGLLSSIAVALSVWGPTFFIRVHGWSIKETGLAFGALSLVSGFLGTIAGGSISDLLRRLGHADPNIRTILVALAMCSIALAAFPALDEAGAAFAALSGAYFAIMIGIGAAMPTMPLIAAFGDQGRLTATYLLVANVFGIGTAPTLVALINDLVFKQDHSIGLAAATFCLICAPVCAALLLASRRWVASFEKVPGT